MPVTDPSQAVHVVVNPEVVHVMSGSRARVVWELQGYDSSIFMFINDPKGEKILKFIFTQNASISGEYKAVRESEKYFGFIIDKASAEDTGVYSLQGGGVLANISLVVYGTYHLLTILAYLTYLCII